MIKRHITKGLLQALADTPVVVLHGARQSGKSTLVRWVAERIGADYQTLDDATTLSSASLDPDAFVRRTPGPTVIDEVQLVPDLFRAIKLEVDRRRKPGRFLLTGSANVLMLPRLSTALVGRVEILRLWPFSVGEMEGVREGLVDRLVESEDPWHDSADWKVPVWLIDRLMAGGFPEVTSRAEPARRAAWFGSYITTILQRDVRQMSDIAALDELPRLLRLLGSQSGDLLNMAELSRDSGLSQPTIKRYLALLQATHLYQPLSAWSGNVRKRLIKSSKAYLNDTGLLAYLLGLDAQRLDESGPPIGRMLEAFVHVELRKQITWSRTRPSIFYYRTAGNREVDFVLEWGNGQLAGIEVKAATKLDGDDFKGLLDLAQSTGQRFRIGVVLYRGSSVQPFGDRLWAVPVGALFAAG